VLLALAGKINTTDLDSRNVKTPRSYTQGYNVQAVVTERRSRTDAHAQSSGKAKVLTDAANARNRFGESRFGGSSRVRVGARVEHPLLDREPNTSPTRAKWYPCAVPTSICAAYRNRYIDRKQADLQVFPAMGRPGIEPGTLGLRGPCSAG